MTPKPPGLLVRYIKEGRCVVFVGAGLSAGAGLPTWKQLLLDVITDMASTLPGGEREEEELRKLVGQGKLLEVAEHCKERLGGSFHSLLTEKVRGDTAPVPESFRLLMRIPFAAWVTTNYDKLLERAYSEERGGFPRVLTHMDTEPLGRLLFDDGQFVLKAHGDIDRHGTVVLTSRDYADIIHANPSFNAVFSSLLLTRALLFVGYSLSDPDFRLLMDRQFTAFKGFVPDRYALMGGLGQVEQDVLWRTARIRVLPYPEGQHGEVLNFLRLLKDAVAPEVKAAAPLATPVASPSPGGVARAVLPPPQPARAASPQAPVLESLVETSGGSAEARAEQGPLPTAPFVARGSEPRAVAPTSVPPEALVLSIEPEGRQGLRMSLASGDMPLAQGRVSRDLGPLLAVLARLGDDAEHARRHRLQEELSRVLAEYAPPEVVRALGEQARSSEDKVVLRLAPEVEWVPWELLPVDTRPLALRGPLVRAPVGITDAARGLSRPRSPARVLLLGDVPSGPELQRLAKLHEDSGRSTCTVLVDAPFERVMDELEKGYDFIHFAGHAGYGPEGAYLLLADEVPLTVSALRAAMGPGAPAFLFLNACFSAFVPPGVTPQGPAHLPAHPEGHAGFTRLTTEVGVGAFIGCFGAPDARAAAHFAEGLHQGLLDGLPVADAVLRARLEALKAAPEDVTAFQYSLSGYGDLRLR